MTTSVHKPPITHAAVQQDWLDQHVEEVLDPDLPIIDPHHHLWDFPGARYMFPDFLRDAMDGHAVLASVYVQCKSMYRMGEPKTLRSLGETEFANGIGAQSASGLYGDLRACAGIVANCDLRLEESALIAVLEAHLAAARSRLRGIRQPSNWHPSPDVPANIVPPPEGLLAHPCFRRGVNLLGSMGLSLDIYCFHTQIREVTAMARACPGTSIILDHCGVPLGIGPYSGQREAVFQIWRTDLQELATCPNVMLKLGGLGMPTAGFSFESLKTPATSAELAIAWRPYIESGIEAFGANRCMFESNFPVDKVSGSYRTFWNAFKRLAAGTSNSERQDLFAGTARRVYRIEEVTV